MEAKIINNSELLAAVLKLLQDNHLPYADILPGKNLLIGYYDATGELIGSGGLEFYGQSALLRSVAVVPTHRGKSAGHQIVNDLIRRAGEYPVEKIYLLTETAFHYFPRFGFIEIVRDQVPPEVRASSEFSSVCPATAACMVYTIK